MSCACTCLSPFHYAEHPGDSIFMADPAFYKGARTGATMSALQTAAVERYARRTGRSAGSISGISAKGDFHIEESNHRRAKGRAS
jgi:hypothetical protein